MHVYNSFQEMQAGHAGMQGTMSVFNTTPEELLRTDPNFAKLHAHLMTLLDSPKQDKYTQQLIRDAVAAMDAFDIDKIPIFSE